MNGDEQKPPASNQPDGQWQYKPEATAVTPAAAPLEPVAPVPPAEEYEQEVMWTASEYIAHHKSFSWYGALGLAAVIFAAAVYLLTKDLISTSIIIVAAILFGVAAGRKPRTLDYILDMTGLSIGSKFYAYGDFKSFAVDREGAFSSIMFLPLKRFLPPITIYYDPKDEERIAAVLSHHLPLENHEPGVIDRITNRVRF
jgi:hypothetical protein